MAIKHNLLACDLDQERLWEMIIKCQLSGLESVFCLRRRAISDNVFSRNQDQPWPGWMMCSTTHLYAAYDETHQL